MEQSLEKSLRAAATSAAIMRGRAAATTGARATTTTTGRGAATATIERGRAAATTATSGRYDPAAGTGTTTSAAGATTTAAAGTTTATSKGTTTAGAEDDRYMIGTGLRLTGATIGGATTGGAVSRGDRHRRRREREDPAWTARDDRISRASASPRLGPRGRGPAAPRRPAAAARTGAAGTGPRPSWGGSRSLSWSPPPAVRRQMAELKAGRRARRRRRAGRTRPKTGKFGRLRWVEHTPVSQLPSNPATRKERRLYVGNLPQTFDGEQLRIFLNEALRACGAIPAGVDEVVVGSWVSPDKKFAFVELSTVGLDDRARPVGHHVHGLPALHLPPHLCCGCFTGHGHGAATTDQNGAAYAPASGQTQTRSSAWS